MDYSKYDGHTPGPWSPTRGDYGWEITRPDNRGGTATILDNSDGSGVSEHAANARLIADAPLLLARCKALEAALDRVASELDGDPHRADLLNSVAAALAGGGA